MPDPMTSASENGTHAAGPWWKEMTRYHWFVFAVCSLAWMADCMDQQLFNLARRAAVSELLGQSSNEQITAYATYSTSIFLIGWALGGIGFGIMGDRVGRVKTLFTTILLYSLFTGLSSLSVGVWDFFLYRFLTGLGVGGVFAVAVALLAETMPDRARPYTLGSLQALSAVGNSIAAGLYIWLGYLEQQGQFDNYSLLGFENVKPWRIMFLIGLVPALLAIFVRGGLKEPEKWKQAVAAGGVKKAGSFSELLGDSRWRSHAIFGLILAFAGVVGLWGIGFFAIDLQQYVLTKTFVAEADQMGLTGAERDRYIGGQRTQWAGITSLMLQLGAFFGMSAFSIMTQRYGRRIIFAITFLLAAGSTILVFWKLDDRSDIFWMLPIMGFFQLALFGGYAIYLPELFPTRLRSTGTSFCYNVGRFVAASGPFVLGLLTQDVFNKDNGYPEGFRQAGMVLCSVFLLGLIVLPFLPETKGKPLPE